MKHFAGRGLRGAFFVLAGVMGIAAASASEDGEVTHFPIHKPTLQQWTFSGPFGTFDQAQLQRGFQVYREVCASCHGLDLVAFRHLADEGGPRFSVEEVKALAAEYEVEDGPDEVGDMFDRPGRPYDYLPSPFPNAVAAAASNGGAAPPDLSLMAKARAAPRGLQWAPVDFFTGYQEAGPDYIYALLTGYEEPPASLEVADGTYYNPYYLASAALAMPNPLDDGYVTYTDGSPETVDQYARDVSAFLMWAAEPHLVVRKRIGFQVMIFLVIFAGMVYLTKKKVWSKVVHA
jgi:ubiquinol-cytochrome c reductase cytochrome c1 subunit